jgi:hypothetical protein
MKLKFGLRKIQVIHGSAFVNLPHAWIQTHSLEKGDKVDISFEEDGTLSIACSKAVKEGDEV